jgi:hypothetical protein
MCSRSYPEGVVILREVCCSCSYIIMNSWKQIKTPQCSIFENWEGCASQMYPIPYIVHYFWPEPIMRFWSKVVPYIGNRLPFGMQSNNKHHKEWWNGSGMFQMHLNDVIITGSVGRHTEPLCVRWDCRDVEREHLSILPGCQTNDQSATFSWETTFLSKGIVTH